MKITQSTLCMLMVAGVAAASLAAQTPTAKRPAPRAKRVWTNEDIERPAPAPKPAAKPAAEKEAAPAAPAAPATPATPAAPVLSDEQKAKLLEQLDAEEAEAVGVYNELSPQRTAIIERLKALHEERDTVQTTEALADVNRRIDEAQKELKEIVRPLSEAERKMQNVASRRKHITAPPEDDTAPEKPATKPQ